MSADLHLHIIDEHVTERDLRVFFSNHMGHKWFAGFAPLRGWEEACIRLSAAPGIWIGEVSWLKGAVFQDMEAFVPGTVQAVSALVDDGVTVINDAFIAAMRQAFEQPNQTDYRIADADAVGRFLEQHRGKVVFTVSW